MGANRKTLLGAALALAVLAGLAAMLVGSPVGAAPGKKAAPIVAGFANGPEAMPNTMTTVRSLDIPKGSWAISAKLYVAGGVYAHCRLAAGGDYDDAKAGLWGTPGTVAGTLHMAVVHQFKTAGSAAVSCTDQGGGMDWEFLKITAISGKSFTNTAL